MKDHFLQIDTPINQVRYTIFQLMEHFEKMHDLLGALLEFQIGEEKAKDEIERHLVEMEKKARFLTKELGLLEKNHTEKEQKEFENSAVYEAVRRTYNLLTGLNIIDLNGDKWVRITSKCLIEKVYYRQIKSLVFSKN